MSRGRHRHHEPAGPAKSSAKRLPACFHLPDLAARPHPPATFACPRRISRPSHHRVARMFASAPPKVRTIEDPATPDELSTKRSVFARRRPSTPPPTSCSCSAVTPAFRSTPRASVTEKPCRAHRVRTGHAERDHFAPCRPGRFAATGLKCGSTTKTAGPAHTLGTRYHRHHVHGLHSRKSRVLGNPPQLRPARPATGFQTFQLVRHPERPITSLADSHRRLRLRDSLMNAMPLLLARSDEAGFDVLSLSLLAHPARCHRPETRPAPHVSPQSPELAPVFHRLLRRGAQGYTAFRDRRLSLVRGQPAHTSPTPGRDLSSGLRFPRIGTYLPDG